MKLDRYKFKKEELENVISEHNKYFAHLSKNETKKEFLIEHILLVQEYFFKIIEKHKLEDIILRIISNITSKTALQEYIAEIFVKSIAIHDFGKVNPKFQKEKMKNDNIEDITHNLSSTHSLISAYIYILYSELIVADKIPEEEGFIDNIILSFSYPILMHHSSYLNSIDEINKCEDNLDDLKEFINLFSCFKNKNDFIEEINNYVISNISNLINNFIDNIDSYINDSFSLFVIVKLLYSLLTAADYYSTTHFMNNWEQLHDDLGILNRELKNKIIENIKITKNYNKTIYDELDNYIIEFPLQQSNENLNRLRQNIATEIILEVRKNINESLFYIEAPTGSGKTNLSMLTLAEFLKNDLKANKITKIFYVFPFITLITQTFQSLKETFGLSDTEIAQIHSKSGFLEKYSSDDIYGKDSKNLIDYLFMNYPIVLISHVKFFDVLKSNKKSANYLLHRFANSIVIIDELQAYSPSEWDKIVYFIVNYSKLFNIKFILMSATLPKIDGLLIDQNLKNSCKFISLVKDKNKYFANPNFKNRVEFNYNMLSENLNRETKEETFSIIWNKVLEKSKEYFCKHNKIYTVIEFIYNSTAGKFTQFVKEYNNFFDEIFLLSGSILEPRRKEIIAKLKSNKYRDRKILLITTQVVEAGVDIDMDLGFKDISLVDSDEQLAGRINRNIKKKECKLFLFDLDNAGIIYSKDYRYKLLDNSMHKRILENKNFDELYKIVIKHKNEINKSVDYINISDYLKHVRRLEFSKINNEFKLINGITTSVFVPIDIPIEIPESNEKNFSQEEIEFLEKKNAIVNKKASGQKVWEIYCDIIEAKNTDFFSSRKQQIIIQGILSKFVFSVMLNSKNYNNLINSGNCEEKYGFLFLHNVNEIYSYEMGILINDEQTYNFW